MKWTLWLPIWAVFISCIQLARAVEVEEKEEAGDPRTLAITIAGPGGAVLASTTPVQTGVLAAVFAGLALAGLVFGLLFPLFIEGKFGGDDGGDPTGTGTGGGGGSYGSYGYGGSSYGAPSTGYGSPSGGGSSYQAPSTGYGASGNAGHGYQHRQGKAEDDEESLLEKLFGRSKRDVQGGSKIFAHKTMELFDMMGSVDLSDCHRRLVCDLATGNVEDFQNTIPILNLFNDSLDPHVHPHIDQQTRNYKYELKLAKKFGQTVKSIDECERVFHCPYTGKQLDKLVYAGNAQRNPDGSIPAELNLDW